MADQATATAETDCRSIGCRGFGAGGLRCGSIALTARLRIPAPEICTPARIATLQPHSMALAAAKHAMIGEVGGSARDTLAAMRSCTKRSLPMTVSPSVNW